MIINTLPSSGFLTKLTPSDKPWYNYSIMSCKMSSSNCNEMTLPLLPKSFRLCIHIVIALEVWVTLSTPATTDVTLCSSTSTAHLTVLTEWLLFLWKSTVFSLSGLLECPQPFISQQVNAKFHLSKIYSLQQPTGITSYERALTTTMQIIC